MLAQVGPVLALILRVPQKRCSSTEMAVMGTWHLTLPSVCPVRDQNKKEVY